MTTPKDSSIQNSTLPQNVNRAALTALWAPKNRSSK